MVVRKTLFENELVGHIVDYQSSSDWKQAIDSLLSFAICRLEELGCEYIQCLEGDHLSPFRTSCNWYSEEGRQLDLILRSTSDDGGDTPSTGLFDWYLTLGDCDVF